MLLESYFFEKNNLIKKFKKIVKKVSSENENVPKNVKH